MTQAVHVTPPDGSTSTSFDAAGRPVRVDYGADGGSRWTFSDGLIVDRNAAGIVTREERPDGSVFLAFDAAGRPTAGTVPTGTGSRQQPVRITYQPDGGSTWSFSDGTQFVRDADGAILSQRLPDGSTFTSFDASGRPTGGTVPSGGTVRVDYTADGASIWSLQNGTALVRDPDGTLVRQVLADGSVFTAFDGKGRPTAGNMPVHLGDPASAVQISYLDNGGSVWSYQDGTCITRDASGAVIRELLPDGTDYTAFDSDGRPTAVTIPAQEGIPAQEVTASYQEDGGSTWAYSDGTIIVRNIAGDMVSHTLPDGSVVTSFDGDSGGGGLSTLESAPAGGVGVPAEGRPPAVFARFNASAEPPATAVQNPIGAVVRPTTPDGWTFTAFDDKGRPTAGVLAQFRQPGGATLHDRDS